jgi:hypothetical protein
VRTPGGASTSGLTLALDLFDDAGTYLFGTRGALPAELPPALAASQRADDEPDTRVASGVIHHPPLANGALRLVATLLDGRADGREVIDRRETQVRIEPDGAPTQGLLSLDHAWSWEESAPGPAPAPVNGATLFRR